MKALRITHIVLVSAMLVALLPIVAGTPAHAATCTTTLAAGSDIQAAIDAANAGDVICLAPGTYLPTARIEINKSVTLQGPQTKVDPRTSAGTTRTPGNTSTEAIVDGGGRLATILRITADNVVLDGLEIRNSTGDMVDSPSGSDIANVAVRYNILHDALGDEGMQLRDCTDCVIEYNHIFDIAQDGINLCCGSTGGLIQFNEVHEDHSENAAIYVYEATLTTIQCNLVYNVTRNEGIKLGIKGGGDAERSGGSIRYNVVHDTAQDGIAVYTSDTLVDGNEVYYSNSENGAIYVAYAVADVTVADNNVHDNTLNPVKWGDPAGITIGTAVDAASVTVHNNNITGNVVNGVTNKAATQLNAQANWWGAADGPGVAGPGSGDTVSTNVDFANWLTERAQPEGENPCEVLEYGSLEVTKTVDWNGFPVDTAQTFEICITGPQYPTGTEDGACQTVDYDGGVLTWSRIYVGEYTVSELPLGTAWTVDITGSPVTVVEDQTAQAGVTNIHEKPTAIELASFTTEAGVGSVTLAWETATEMDNAGFNLHRAIAPNGPYTQINDALIAAQGGPASGVAYSLVDQGLAPGTYYYTLEDVDYSGATALHGPISATVAPALRRPAHRPMLPALD